jgi:hypothetical protein
MKGRMTLHLKEASRASLLKKKKKIIIIMGPHGLSFERSYNQYRKWPFSHFMMKGHLALRFKKKKKKKKK